MTIRSVGYDGAIGETDWSQYLAPYLGAYDVVARAGDFYVSAASGNLSVDVATGIAHSYGVTDVSDATVNIQLAAATTGTRYDCIVLRRNWSGQSVTPSGVATGGQTSVAIVQGGSSRTSLPALKTTGGTMTEQPLALVQVTAGSQTVVVVEDLRTTYAKAAYVRSMLAMTGPPGTRYVLEPDMKRYVMRVNPSSKAVEAVPEWEPPAQTIPAIPQVDGGTAAVNFSSTGAATITHNLGRDPKVVHVAPRLTASSPLLTISLSTQAGATSRTSFVVTAKVATATGWAPYYGALTYVDWIAVG